MRKVLNYPMMIRISRCTLLAWVNPKPLNCAEEERQRSSASLVTYSRDSYPLLVMHSST